MKRIRSEFIVEFCECVVYIICSYNCGIHVSINWWDASLYCINLGCQIHVSTSLRTFFVIL